MHMSVDRYYCYIYQNAENEDMIYGNHHTDVFYNSIYICSLLIYYIISLPICNPYVDALKRKIFDLKYIT